MRLMTGFSRTVDDQIAGVGAGDRDVGEQLGRVEVLQRLIERLGGVGLAGRQVGVGANRLRLEALVAANGDRADRAAPRRGAGAGAGGGSRRGACRRRLAGWRRGLREQRRGQPPRIGSDQKQRAGAPAETLRS